MLSRLAPALALLLAVPLSLSSAAVAQTEAVTERSWQSVLAQTGLGAATPYVAPDASGAPVLLAQAGDDAESSIIELAPLPIPVIDPYRWSAEKLPAGTIALAGHLPAEPLRRVIIGRSGDRVVDQTALGSGAPALFPVDALAGLDALLLLDEGKLSFTDGAWTLAGRTEDAAVPDAVRLALGERASSANWEIEIIAPAAPSAEVAEPASPSVDTPVVQPPEGPELQAAEPLDTQPQPTPAAVPEAEAEPPPPATEPDITAEPSGTLLDGETEPPGQPRVPADSAAEDGAAPAPTEPQAFLFTASRSNTGPVSLTGIVPAEATRKYIAVVAGDVPADGLTVAQGLPESFTSNATAGLRALLLLPEARLQFDGSRWYLGGTADSVAQRDQVLALIAALPDTASWEPAIGLTPPVELCQRRVAEFTATHTILFQSGSARMTDESLASLEELARNLGACPETAVYVEGHTDADGADDLNLALSVARAEAVVAALIERGVNSTRLYAVGYGETLPIAPNDTQAGKRANRRIVFTIYEEEQ